MGLRKSVPEGMIETRDLLLDRADGMLWIHVTRTYISSTGSPEHAR